MTVTKTTVVPFVLTATGTGTAQQLTAVGDAGHRFSTDAYPAFGGQDAAPSPLFYALGSLTSCNQVTATQRCRVGQPVGERSPAPDRLTRAAGRRRDDGGPRWSAAAREKPEPAY